MLNKSELYQAIEKMEGSKIYMNFTVQKLIFDKDLYNLFTYNYGDKELVLTGTCEEVTQFIASYHGLV